MAGRLEGKIALITGTGGGQGREAALRFSREGAKVVGCDLKFDGAQETVKMAQDAGGKMVSKAPVDLSSEDEVKALIDFAVESYGGIDILYNNAGAIRTGAIENLSLEDFNFTLVNEITLIFLAIKHVLPVFKQRGKGVIVNTGSIAANVGSGMVGNLPGLLSHALAKAAVIRMSTELAVELAPMNVRVNSVSPGVIDTPALRPFLADAEVRQAYINHLLIPRIGLSEDIVNGALYLASDEASYVTGINLVIDGGWTASGGAGLPSKQVAESMDRAVAAFFSTGYSNAPTA